MTTPAEKLVLTEFLQLYKELTCLWDIKRLEYNNKEAREKAYEILLEKYREYQEGASLLDVKKKIEYMRTTFRREEKKVLKSKLYGDCEQYTPKLWYYSLFSFLGEAHPKLESTSSCGRKSEVEEKRRKSEEVEEVKFKEETSEDNSRKRKALSAVYLPEQDHHSSYDEDEAYAQDEDSLISSANQLAEAEAFGTTIGLQLKELDPLQRVFAEKIISDAIFQARLHKLNENSVIVSNCDMNVRPNL